MYTKWGANRNWRSSAGDIEVEEILGGNGNGLANGTREFYGRGKGT